MKFPKYIIGTAWPEDETDNSYYVLRSGNPTVIIQMVSVGDRWNGNILQHAGSSLSPELTARIMYECAEAFNEYMDAAVEEED